MTKKLKPVVGLAVAGLIGTAYATCYWGITGVCAPAGTFLEWLPLSCGDRELKTKNDWYAIDMFTTNGSGPGGHTGLKSKDCCGTATYTDCSGHAQDIQNYCLRDYYTAPDPATPGCSS